jgi:hypothetical protein
MSCNSANSDNSLSVDKFNEIISAGNVQIVDVRTPQEYGEGHISGAVNIDVMNSGFEQNVDKSLDKNIPVAIYCRSGNRSKTAMKILLKKGFKVYELDKGFIAWKSAGMKIEY